MEVSVETLKKTKNRLQTHTKKREEIVEKVGMIKIWTAT